MMDRQALASRTDLFRVALWVTAVPLTLMLSAYATWFAISRYPIPDSDAINLGLFAFFGVLLLDVFFVCDRVVVSLRKEGRITPGELARIATIFLGGALLAALFGLSVWLIWGLASKPWGEQFVRILFPVLFTIFVWWWSFGSGLRPTLDGRRDLARLRLLLWGTLLVAGSNLLMAILGFLNDQGWIWGWRLAIGLLLVPPIARMAMEISRRRRAKNSAR
jgi:hypothetical protein